MAPRYLNNAGRLLEILKRVAKDPNTSHNCKMVWARAFEVNPDDFLTVAKKLAKCLVAFDRIEAEIRRLKPERSFLYDDHFPLIRQVLAPTNFDSDFSQYSRILNQGALTTLEVCASDLPVDKPIPDDELTTIRGDVDNLFEEVLAAGEIEPKLKNLLLQLLSQMRRSIDDFWIHGAEGLEDGMSYIIGQLALHADVIKKEKSNLVKRCLESAVRFGMLVSSARGWAIIGTAVKQWFLPGDTPAEPPS